MRVMACAACGCPGAQQLLTTIVCPNPDCRWHDAKRLDVDHRRCTINGVSTREIYEWISARRAAMEA